MSSTRLDWTLYFLYGSMAVVLSWCTSGCRFGNQVVTHPTSTAADPYVGYYVTQPQTLTFYATLDSDASTPLKKTTLTTLVPSELEGLVPNPMIVGRTKAGDYVLARPDPKTAGGAIGEFLLSIQPDRSFSFEDGPSRGTYGLDPACQEEIQISGAGNLVQKNNLADPSGSDFPIVGVLQLDVQVSRNLIGSCSGTLQSLVNCYKDYDQCGAPGSAPYKQFQYLASAITPMLESEIITLDDVPHLMNYMYEVSYQ